MRTVIIGSGIALPANVVPNEKLARIMDTSDEWIRTRSGIEQRYYADPGQGSAELGTEAARNALVDAGLEPAAIDAVVFATMTPNHIFPGNGPLLQQQLGLANSIPTFDIRQQCSGFLYALDLADALVRSGKYRRVLIVGAEVHSPFMPWSNGWDSTIGRSEREVTEEEKAYNTRFRDRTVLFGDAGAAVVVEGGADDGVGLLATRLFTDGSSWKALAVSIGFTQRPWVTQQQLDDAEYIPTMEGREVYRQAVSKMPEAVRQVCADAGVAVEELDLVLVHQANLRIIEAVQKQLGLASDRVPHNIERYGNTTAATLPLLWHECVKDGRIRPGMKIAFTALGSGLHWGAALYRS